MVVLHPELKKAVQNNKLIVFAGAGLSWKLKNTLDNEIGGWKNLVKQILEHLKKSSEEEKKSVEHLIPLLETYEPIKILELIELNQNLSKSKISFFVKEFFDLHEEKNDYDIHKKITELSNKIITTNYDTAFEEASKPLRKYKAYKGKNYELTTHKETDSKLLFKLHGCFEDFDSMVLFPSDYRKLYQNNEKDAEHSLFVLKNIIYNNSLLFIGTGMGDYQINSIFKEIKKLQGEYNQKHFIITTDKLDSSLNFLTPISIENHSEIKTVINELLEIKKKYTSEKKEETIKLKNELEENTKKIEELERELENEKEIKNRQALLLERESLKYFSKGIKFHLSNQYEKANKNYKTIKPRST